VGGESIARPGEAIEFEVVTTRYGLECDLLPEENFYLVCAYDVNTRGATIARRVLGKSASYRAAGRDVMRLRDASSEAA